MNNNSKLVVGLLLASLVLTVIPSATAAAAPNAGTFVKAGDVDIAYTYAAVAPAFAAFCFVDLNNDGGQQPAEPLYLSRTGGCGAASIKAGDVRLTAAFGKAGGTTVTGADDDLSRNALAAAGWNYKFFDADGNGAYNPGDIVYVGLAAGAVAINDVAINGANAFSRVTSSSPNYNTPTAPMANLIGTELFFNADGVVGYGVGDSVYLAGLAPIGAAPAVGDIRLTPLGTVYKGGTTVIGTDSDVTVVAVALGAAPGLCFVDTNGDGKVSSGEPLYVQFTTPACGVNSVASGDYRVIATAGKSGGTLVGGSDDDYSRNTIADPDAAWTFAFFDTDGSGGYSQGDQVYLNVDPTTGAAVTVNDVMISGTTHNTQVVSTTSGLNNALTAIAIANVGVFNADGVGAAGTVSTGDYLYLLPVVAGPATSPGVNTVRLTMVGSYAAGSWVNANDVDAVAAVAGATGYLAFCYIDINADGIQQANEPVYLTAACAVALPAKALRVTANSPYQAGTLVKGSDDDFSRVTTAPVAAGGWAIYDQDASGAYTNGEPVFVDYSAAAPCAVTPNDIAITTNQFVRVTSTTAGINSPLLSVVCAAVPAIPAVGAELATEADGIAGFSTGDNVYLDMDATASVTVGDVRLSAIGSTTGQIGGGVGGDIGGGSSSPTPEVTTPVATTPVATTPVATTPVATTPVATTPVQTVPPPASTPVPPAATTSPTGTPGFELVALVAALGVALVLVRRQL